jgi:hypothetical protein
MFLFHNHVLQCLACYWGWSCQFGFVGSTVWLPYLLDLFLLILVHVHTSVLRLTVLLLLLLLLLLYNLPLILLEWRVIWIRLALRHSWSHCTCHSNAASPWHWDSYTERFNLIQTVQLLSATGPTKHCAVSIQLSSGHPPQTDQRFSDRTDRKSSPENPQLKSQHYFCAAWSSIAYGTVQLWSVNCSRTVQITKPAVQCHA